MSHIYYDLEKARVIKNEECWWTEKVIGIFSGELKLDETVISIALSGGDFENRTSLLKCLKNYIELCPTKKSCVKEAIAYFTGIGSSDNVSPVFKAFILDQLEKAQTTNERWYARDLQKILNYSAYSRFASQENKKSILKAARVFVENSDLHFKPCERNGAPDWELDAIAIMAMLRECRNRPSVIVAKQFFGDLIQDSNNHLASRKDSEVVFSSESSPSKYVTLIHPFEEITHSNEDGTEYWLATELEEALELQGDERGMLTDMEKHPYTPLMKAYLLAAEKRMPVERDFQEIKVDFEDHIYSDWRLTTLACYLVFAQCNFKEPKILEAQQFFAYITGQEYGEKIPSTLIYGGDLAKQAILNSRPDKEKTESLKAIIPKVESDSSDLSEIIPSPKPVEKNKSNPLPSGISPFDAIRRYDKEGQEYWSARELMEFMGYDTWRRFENPIEEAIENLELTGEIAENHIAASDKVVHRPQGGGSTLSDYKLSRHGCYMIAICCDRRKPEVAMAKRYFTRATRENELRKQREAEPKKKTASEAIAFATQCLIDAGIEKPVVNQYQLRQLAKIEPENAEYYENACAQLASGYILENKPILVTKVGQMICDRLGLNRNIISFAKTVNQKLVEIGLQEKDIRYKEGKPYNKGYVLTEAGKPWAIVENPTDSEGRVRPQIKWLPQIVDVLLESADFGSNPD